MHLCLHCFWLVPSTAGSCLSPGWHGIPVALKHNYFYVQSAWNNVRNVLHSTKMFFSPGTDIVYDRPWGSLVVEDGVVKNCTKWGEPTLLQSYVQSFSVWSLVWIIPRWIEGALEKTGLNHPEKAWGRRNNWTLYAARGQALRFDSFHFTIAHILELSLLRNFAD